MNKVLAWLRDNTLVALGMVALAAATAGAHQAGEANAVAYKMLAAQWSLVSAPVKAEIAEAMRDGTVTRWEYTKLWRDIFDDRRALVLETEAGPVEQERDKLRREIAGGHQ